MYFEYSSGENHSRTITQGVRLADSRKASGKYRRDVAQTAGGTGVTTRIEGFCRNLVEAVTSTVILTGLPTLIIKLVEAIAALYGMEAGAGFKRGIGDTAGNSSIMGGMVRFFRTLFSHGGAGDRGGSFITRMRVIQDRGSAGDEAGRGAEYVRGLFAEAGNMAETSRRGTYCRVQEDTVFSETVSLRHLFMFLRLLTGAYVRDYIIGRFLRSRDELVIKSPVVRETGIESGIR
jgi:hypothetical protein